MKPMQPLTIVYLTLLALVLSWGGYFAGLHQVGVPKQVISTTSSQGNTEPTKITTDPSKVYSVFLTNGQVYFGKLQIEGDNFKLTNVYYYTTTGKPELTKLGGEMHAPEDEMNILKSQILFFEPLRADSPVSQKIK